MRIKYCSVMYRLCNKNDKGDINDKFVGGDIIIEEKNIFLVEYNIHKCEFIKKFHSKVGDLELLTISKDIKNCFLIVKEYDDMYIEVISESFKSLVKLIDRLHDKASNAWI